MQQPKQTAKPQSEQLIRVAGSKDKAPKQRVDTIVVHDTLIVHDTVWRYQVDTVAAPDYPYPFLQHDTVRVKDSTRCSIIPIPIPIPIRGSTHEAAIGPSTVTPEPTTIVLVAIGLLIIGARAWWKGKGGPR